jgi:recombinational DNA repair protein (RecF pathway)
MKLTALQSACALADKTLPEHESHPGVFEGMLALLQSARRAAAAKRQEARRRGMVCKCGRSEGEGRGVEEGKAG